MKLVDIKPNHFYTLRDGTIVRIDHIHRDVVGFTKVCVWETDSQEPYDVTLRDIAAPYVDVKGRFPLAD